MPSVVIPAHNEAKVIARCLASVLTDDRADDLEVIVVCNGCTDDTARVAKEHDERVCVVETDVPSKSNALNLGDDAATSFPRMYLDADVELDPGALVDHSQCTRQGHSRRLAHPTIRLESIESSRTHVLRRLDEHAVLQRFDDRRLRSLRAEL